MYDIQSYSTKKDIREQQLLKAKNTHIVDFTQVVNKTICFLSYENLKNKCNQLKKIGNI